MKSKLMSQRYIMHESCLTPPEVRRHFIAPASYSEVPDGYARKVKVTDTPELLHIT